jgi:hypothetical protein
VVDCHRPTEDGMNNNQLVLIITMATVVIVMITFAMG